MTTPTQMGAEPTARPETPRSQAQQQASAPTRPAPDGSAAAPQQMGATLFSDWAAI